MSLNLPKSAEAQMLIRVAPNLVYRALVDPSITTQFWFTKSTGPLALGEEVTWSWEMYQVSAKVIPTKLLENKEIEFNWEGNGQLTRVNIILKELEKDATYVSVVHDGFQEEDEALVKAIIDSTGGFTILLAGLKAYLEHNINLNLVGDKYPMDLLH